MQLRGLRLEHAIVGSFCRWSVQSPSAPVPEMTLTLEVPAGCGACCCCASATSTASITPKIKTTRPMARRTPCSTRVARVILHSEVAHRAHRSTSLWYQWPQRDRDPDSQGITTIERSALAAERTGRRPKRRRGDAGTRTPGANTRSPGSQHTDTDE